MRFNWLAFLILSLLSGALAACDEAAVSAPALPPGSSDPTPTVSVRASATAVAVATSDEAPEATQLPEVAPTPSPTMVPTASASPTTLPAFYVTSNGSDEGGDGSPAGPWASVTHAVEQVADGATIIVGPGVYHDEVALRRKFARGIIIRAEDAYQTRLEYDETVVTCYTCAGITLEGFEIAHDGEGAGRYVIQIQDLEGDGEGGQRVTLRNNIIHDSRNNDLVKVNNGAGHITLTGNIFYNMGGPHRDSHLDVNSATNVIIEDNIFFNDFGASNRDNDHDTGSFLVIKDSNGDDDANLGSEHVIVRRNIFLNWQGDEGNTFVVIGEDSVDYFQATDVLLENNLMLGNALEDTIQAAFQVRGSRDILFRNNTVAGDLPARVFAMRLARADDNPRNQNLAFYNNIWSDPTATMGSETDGTGHFAEADPGDSEGVTLKNNLYWNGGEPIPADEDQAVNYTNDSAGLIADPDLGRQDGMTLPIWLRDQGRFADGSGTVREAFTRLVNAYGTPAQGSPVIDAADPQHFPAEDILGNPRPVGFAPDIGAVESP